jgi:rhomboid protease GluP
MALLREDPEESVLRLSTGDWIILREARDAGADARLLERISALRASARVPLSLVVLGGVPETPRSPLFSALTVFSIAPDGRLLGGGVLSKSARSVGPILKMALARLKAERGRRLSDADRHALLEAGEALRGSPVEGDEARFWERIRGVRPWATYVLSGVIGLTFLLESVWGGSDFTPTLFRMGANAPDRVRAGEYFRLFAAAFLHIGPIHVLANLWALWVFGEFLERVVGTARFLVLYTFSALCGSLASVLLSKAPLSAGASGALWGLMVGGFALSFWGPVPPGLRSRIRARGWQPILVNLMISFAPGIDLYAHLGGGLSGGALVLLWTRLDPAARPATRSVVGFSALCALAMGVSLLGAVREGRPWELVDPPKAWKLVRIPKTGVDIEIPEALGSLRGPGPSQEWALGAFPRDPVVGFLRVSAAADDRQPLGLARELDDEPPPQGMLPEEKSQELATDRVARRRYRHRSGASETVWLAQVEGVRLRLELVGLPGASPPWLSLGDRMASSLKGRLSP